MALQQQSLNINFSQGLDTKTDPYQVAPGRFLSLVNSVFNKGGRLEKRNGYLQLTSLPDSNSQFVTTFNNNLTAIGTDFYAYSSSSAKWVDKGDFHPLDLEVTSLLRNNTSQTQCDSAVSSNGFVCTVYTDNIPTGSPGVTAASYRYVIADVNTGQNIIAPTEIPDDTGTISGSPRVFALGNYFVIVFTNTITADDHLQFIAVNIYNPTSVSANTDITTDYDATTATSFDGVVANNTLYLAWNGDDVGGAIRVTRLDSTLTQYNTEDFAGESGEMFSLCADESGSTPNIWVTAYDSNTPSGVTICLDSQLNEILAPTEWTTSTDVLNVATSATGGTVTIYYEIDSDYTGDLAGTQSDYIGKVTVTSGGVVGTPSVFKRSVGLASKAFFIGDKVYFLSVFSSSHQPTFFLLQDNGDVVAKLAYSNAGGYITLGLPGVSVFDDVAYIPYLIRTQLETSPTYSAGGVQDKTVFAQTGINLATFTFGTSDISVSELGKNLNLSGGFLWAYDGYQATEQGFFLWPDPIGVTTSGSGGSIAAGTYYYQVTYEYTDNQGNIFRSAPSIPKSIVTTGASSTNTITVPTLRLTYKTSNPVKICIYRWTSSQPLYYQVTSTQAPLYNSTSTDSVTFADTQADSTIASNSILYTTGGVVENIGAPAISSTTIFKSRLVGINAENRNELWYSKQVIQGTPVEMTDLFTIFVPPTNASEGTTGPMRAVSTMDDKLIIFKKNAIYYIVGNGPDNTGANNDFSDPIFITSTVGCSNQRSIVYTPQGLMFQSDKGIWLLGRDLSTQYIGAPVADFNSYTVLSAVNVPSTNQIRFTLSNGVTLMYDYFYNQWGSFEGVPCVSSTIYDGLHTFINSYGKVYKENPGSYLDGTNPVLMSFKTGWMNVAGLQGFQRAYSCFLLGTYVSPHKLSVSIAYNYSPASSQTSVIVPENFNGFYGDSPLYGDEGTYGGTLPLEQWQVYFQRQKCESFQIQIQESFDATFATVAGAGLTLSGLNLVIGVKSGWPRIKASLGVG